MTHDPGLEEQLTENFGNPDAPTGKAMLGGWCFMLNGNMPGAARDGRAMFRVGKDARTAVLTLPRVEQMAQGGRAKPGFVWLFGPSLADNAIRRRHAGMARGFVSTLPPEDA